MAQALIQPSPEPARAGAPLLEVEGLTKWYPVRRGWFRSQSQSRQGYIKAVDAVSFRIAAGECVGLAGESGSGKTVTAELIARLQEPTGGSIRFRGAEVTHLAGRAALPFRRQVQMVFQNPFDCFNERLSVAEIIREPLSVHRLGTRREQEERCRELLALVGLQPVPFYLGRLPHQLSGGERQRVAIARALVLEPSLLIADEPTTMLDVSVRAGILNLLRQLQQRLGLAMLFISHDFSTLKYLCHTTAIMYLGKIVEIGPTDSVLYGRYHPYTDALADSIPIPDPAVVRQPANIVGDIPPPTAIPPGCRFSPRCPYRSPACSSALPPSFPVHEGHWSACLVWATGDVAGPQMAYRNRVLARTTAAPAAEKGSGSS